MKAVQNVGVQTLSNIRSKRVYYGLNRDESTWRDDGFYRCKRCGFVVHEDRSPSEPEGSTVGEGIKYTEENNEYDRNLEYDNENVYNFISYYNPVVYAGCPQCGTFLYK